MENNKPFVSDVDRNELENSVTINASEVAPFLNEIRCGIAELNIRAEKEKFILRNYSLCEEGLNSVNAYRTEITLQKTLFNKFIIGRQTEICLCMKEFKAIIAFARQHSSEVGLFFSRPGRPFVVVVENESGYSAEFIIATVESDDLSDNASLVSTRRSPVQFFQEEQNDTSEPNRSTINNDIDELRFNNVSQQSLLPATQPVHQIGEESADIEEFGVQNNKQSGLESGSHSFTDDRVSREKSIMANARCGPEIHREVEDISTQVKSAGPSRKVDIEFQHHFLGIGIEKKKQSQASSMANIIVEATQFEVNRKRRCSNS